MANNNNYVLHLYGGQIKRIFRLKKNEEFVSFDDDFLKNHQPIRMTSALVFAESQWSVAIDTEARGQIICQHKQEKKQQKFPRKDGTLVLKDRGERFSKGKRYHATFRFVQFKPYIREEYMINMLHLEDPNHKYRGELSAQSDYRAACFVFSDGKVTTKYRNPNFKGFKDYNNLGIYEGPVEYTVENASWVVVCRGHDAKKKIGESWGAELHTNRPNLYSILPELDKCLDKNYFGNFFDALIPWWNIS